MKFGLDVPVDGPYADPHLLVKMATEAEAAGWDGFFLQDAFASESAVADPWVSLTAVAVHTRRMRIGILVTPLPRRRPWQVARQAATIDHLSGGRVTFAAGIGYSPVDFTPFGEAWDARVRAAKLDEALDVVTGLWSGSPFSYAGRHYTLEDALVRPAPVQQPRIPVWLAAGWPNRRPLARAVRWDGVYLMTVHQRTGELLRPADIAAVREAAPPDFDIAFNAVRDSVNAAQVRSFADAGATWWVELAPDEGGPPAYRDRIRHGPPT
jgi:alkanesulfonate monooxygenase SsuD/methylene tetrahydromethanopterin reductase-like flavin-dependent oxidoreductase (luciferase family)